MDMGGGDLGELWLEVRADLTKLTNDFAKGKAQAQRFQSDMVTVNRYAREQIEAQEAAQLGAIAATKRMREQQLATADAINRVTRATNPMIANTRLVSSAVRDAEKSYMAGSISANALARAQQIGLPWMQKTTIEAEKGALNLSGWARSTEHHLRAMRLLIGFVGVDLAAKFGEFAVKSIESTASLKYQAEQLNLTTNELQEYMGVASRVGMTTEEMKAAFSTLGKNLDDMRLGRVGPFSKLIQKLGIDITDAAGKVRPTSAIFNDLINKLGRVGDEAQRRGGQAIAFGEAGAKMGELVKEGSQGVDQLREAVRATGIVLSEGQIQKADETAKKLDQIKQVLSAKIASTVVENANAIGDLANALANLVSIGLPNLIDTVSAFAARMHDLADGLRDVKSAAIAITNGAGPTGQNSASSTLGKIMRWGLNLNTGEVGQFDEKGGFKPLYDRPSNPSVTMKLPPARPVASPSGSNIDLSGILSPKAKKGGRGVENQFDRETLREEEENLRLLKERSGNLTEINDIEKRLIDINLQERIEQLQQMVHRKALTAGQAKTLEAQARENADMEKEAADRHLREAQIEASARAADEMAQLDQNALDIALSMARTDEERKRIDLMILDLKQQQEVSELDKQIALATEAKDQSRITELVDQRKKLLENQNAQLKQFDVQHLTGIDKFKNDLPKSKEDFDQAIKDMKFDLFNEKLQQAAGFAEDVGGAFGRLASDLGQFKNPLDALRSFLTDLAGTFTKNFIEKPITDWATQHIGMPAAKQAFGGEMEKMGLSSQQFDVALAQATGSLGALQAAATPTGPALGSIATAAAPTVTALTTLTTAASGAAAALTAAAAAAGSKGASDGLSTIIGLAGAASGGGGGGDMGMFNDLLGSTGDAGLDSLYGFAAGGFTGSGGDGEVKGVVHANEFVVNSSAVGKYGLGLLGSLNSGSAATVGAAPGGAAAAPAADLSTAAAMLMQAAQMLMQAAGGGGGGGGGFLKGLLGVGMGFLLGGKSGAGSSLMGLFGGGGGGGGGGGIAALLGGLGGGTSLMPGGGGGGSLLGDNLALNALGAPGFASGGFTGFGSDSEIAGVVHRNEHVFDAPTTRRLGPLLGMISRGRLPTASPANWNGGSARPLQVSIGGIHVSGARDDRSARRAGRQAFSEIQRRLSDINRTGLNK